MKEKKESVLLVHNEYQLPGGEDTVVENESAMLAKHGHKVILYRRSNKELTSFTILQKFLLPFATVFNLKTYREIKKLIKEEKIEIVHVHNTLALISPSVYYAAKSMRVPVIQTVHNFRLLCPGATFYRDKHICEDCVQHSLWCAVKHKCYRGSRVQTAVCVLSSLVHRMMKIYETVNFICLSEFNKSKLLEFKQIKPESVFVKPNFVANEEPFVAAESRQEQFIYAGRLEDMKGIELLFRAWRELGEEAPKLIVCGTGPMEPWCKTFIKQNQVNIERKGWVSQAETRKLIANSKALILPTQWYEGFPMSIVEAFSVGTPVVCSDLGNAGSLVKEGVTGRKFRSDSAADLCRAVKSCNGMQISTLHEYEEKYTEALNYNELISIYKKVARAK